MIVKKNIELQIQFLYSCLMFLFPKKTIQNEREIGHLLKEFAQILLKIF